MSDLIILFCTIVITIGLVEIAAKLEDIADELKKIQKAGRKNE